MKRLRQIAKSVCLLALVAASLAILQAQAPAQKGRRIAVFGSSVANGTGDELGMEGYTGRLRAMLAPKWEVLNQSRGGDNTKTMAPRFAPDGEAQPNTRYLLPVHPDYVLLGLSLGNEGIRNVSTKEQKDAVFRQFETGMKGFVERSRANHIVPVITLCYTRMDFTEVEYEYTRRMNLAINSWDVPSVNFLGAIDDGTGKWAKGFWFDSLHPNASGHDELTTTFVPTLFDALEQGKPLPAISTATDGGVRLAAGSAPLTFTVNAKMHPFAFVVSVRANGDGELAAISGSRLDSATGTKKIDRGRGPIEFEETTLTPAGPFASTVGVRGGRFTYSSASGSPIASDVKADGKWHQLVVSHYTARGETLFFVDGHLAGTVPERLETKEFVLENAKATKPADFQELMIYRSALNADEVAAIGADKLLQASLEVYSPMTDQKFLTGSPIENRAQSLSKVMVAAAGATRVR